jgi:hypothetical protein
MPHQICTSGATQVSLFYVDSGEFPSGVSIIYLDGRVTSGNTAYLFQYQAWNGGSKEADIANFKTAADGKIVTSASGSTLVQSGREIFIDLPTTEVYTIRGMFRFLRR